MFKAGEKVIHHRFGEGHITAGQSEKYPINFLNSRQFVALTIDGREHEDDLYPSIYYKPQTLDMSKPEPEIGTWGYFWDREIKSAIYGCLCEINNHKFEKYGCSNLASYEHFSPEIPPHIKELMNGTATSNP